MKLRRGWLFAATGLFALAVLLLGALLGGAPASAPAPASPAPTLAVPSPTVAPSPTAVPTDGPVASYWVYFARDGLPPLGGTVKAHAEQNAVDRTVQRLGTLMRAGAQTPPGGTTNPAALIRQRTTISGGTTVAVPAVTVRIEGDLATAEFDIEDWGVRGAAVTEGLVQQLVYTITEEPAIRQARIVEKGKTTATIDQLVLDKPLSREDVFGYEFKGGEVASIENAGDGRPQEITAWGYSNGPIGTLGRLSVEVGRFSPPTEGGATPIPVLLDPTFKAQLAQCAAPSCGSGKWQITLTMPVSGAPALASQPTATNAGAGPIRGVDWRASGGSALMTIYLDDARPWRVSVEPSGPRSVRINVDVGGRPASVNRNIAVYEPEPGSQMPRTFTVSGVARVFEANMNWRVKDQGGRQVATGHTTATLGTGPAWGTFTTSVTVPSSVSGRVTLEVFGASPRDGSDQDVVPIELTLR